MRHDCGFTLIELSIVLVIIGLIVGGVLTGRDLISAAAVRAQITQIEKYNTAANTFRGKYGYLPGDIKDPDASGFGFQPRGTYAGEGDGNGVIEGVGINTAGQNGGVFASTGETAMFWRDLSDARLIDNSFTAASSTSVPAYFINLTSTPLTVGAYMPQAKLGNGNYVYVWSGGTCEVHGCSGTTRTDGINYFGISVPNSHYGLYANSGTIWSDQGMTVNQAFSIDKKVDDGLPQAGNVQAWYADSNKGPNSAVWATGSGVMGDYDANTGGPITPTSTPAWDAGTSSQSCYSNGQNVAVQEKYNLAYPNNINCALSFRFQ